MDIMLQLVVDQLEEHLRRVQSEWVPMPFAATETPAPMSSTLKPAQL
jgi:hypothetical protein